MSVRVDDIADRFVGLRADRGKQLPSFADAAAGVDHGDRVVAHDKSHVGDRAFVFTRHQCDVADMHENARRDFGDRQRLLLRTRRYRCSGQSEHNAKQDAMKSHSPRRMVEAGGFHHTDPLRRCARSGAASEDYPVARLNWEA